MALALCLNIFFFTRFVFSDIIRLNNLIFQVICRFRHLNSNIISFGMIFFTQNFTKISDDIFGIQMSIFFRSEKKNVQAQCHSFPEYIQYGSCRCHTVYANSIAGFPEQACATLCTSSNSFCLILPPVCHSMII